MIELLIREAHAVEEKIVSLTSQTFSYPLIEKAKKVSGSFEISEAKISAKLKEDCSGLECVHLEGVLCIFGKTFPFSYPLNSLLDLPPLRRLPELADIQATLRTRFPDSLYLDLDFDWSDTRILPIDLGLGALGIRGFPVKSTTFVFTDSDNFFLVFSVHGRKTLVPNCMEVINPYVFINPVRLSATLAGTVPMRLWGGSEELLSLNVDLEPSGIPRFQVICETAEVKLLPGLWLRRMGYSFNPTPAVGFCSEFSVEKPGSPSASYGSITAELGAELVNSTLVGEFPKGFRLGYPEIVKMCTGKELGLPGWTELMVLTDEEREGLTLTFKYDPIADEYGFSGKLCLFDTFSAQTRLQYSVRTGLDFLFHAQPLKLGSILAITSADSASRGPLISGRLPIGAGGLDPLRLEFQINLGVMLLGMKTVLDAKLKGEELSLSYASGVDLKYFKSEVSTHLLLNFMSRKFEAELEAMLELTINTRLGRLRVVGIEAKIALKNSNFASIRMECCVLNQTIDFGFSAHLDNIEALPGELVSIVERKIGDSVMGFWDKCTGTDKCIKKMEEMEEKLEQSIRESEERLGETVRKELRDAEIRLQSHLKKQLEAIKSNEKALRDLDGKMSKRLDEAERLASLRSKETQEKLDDINEEVAKTQEAIKRLKTALSREIGAAKDELQRQIDAAESRLNERLEALGLEIGLDIQAVRRDMDEQHTRLLVTLATHRELAQQEYEEMLSTVRLEGASIRDRVDVAHRDLQTNLRVGIAALASHLTRFEERVEALDRANTELIRTGFAGLHQDIHAARFALTAHHRGAAQSELDLASNILEDHVIRAPINDLIVYGRYLDPLDHVKYWLMKRSVAPELTGSMEVLDMSSSCLASDLPRLVKPNARSLAWNLGMLWQIFHTQGLIDRSLEVDPELIANVQLWQMAARTFIDAAPILRPEYDPSNRLIIEALRRGLEIGVNTQRLVVQALPCAIIGMWDAHRQQVHSILGLLRSRRSTFLSSFSESQPWIIVEGDEPRLDRRYQECLASSESFRALQSEFDGLDQRFKVFQYLLQVCFGAEAAGDPGEVAHELPSGELGEIRSLEPEASATRLKSLSPQLQFFVLQHLLNDLLQVAEPSFEACAEGVSISGLFSGTTLRQTVLNRPAVIFGDHLEAGLMRAISDSHRIRDEAPPTGEARAHAEAAHRIRLARAVAAYRRNFTDACRGSDSFQFRDSDARVNHCIDAGAARIRTCLVNSQLMSPALTWGLESTSDRIRHAIKQEEFIKSAESGESIRDFG